MNGDSFSVLKYYLKTSWSTRKINKNSKFYVSNDLIWYSETIGKFRNNSFVCFFFLFVCFSNFYFIQESSICSNFSFACLWLTSCHFVAVICQCLLFFAEGKLLQSSSMHRVWHCTRKQCQSIWTGGATNLDKGVFGSAHFAISLTTNSSTDNRL